MNNSVKLVKNKNLCFNCINFDHKLKKLSVKKKKILNIILNPIILLHLRKARIKESVNNFHGDFNFLRAK